MRSTRIITCQECLKPFAALQSELKRGRGKFCSLSCSAHNGNKRRSLTGKFLYCATCGKRLYRTQKRLERNKTGTYYCDRDCKKKAEGGGLFGTKRLGKHRRDHLANKQQLLDEHGVKCLHPGCDLELHNDRRLVDTHHFEHALDHSKTLLLCPYHHRLADLGYVTMPGFAEKGERITSTEAKSISQAVRDHRKAKATSKPVISKPKKKSSRSHGYKRNR